MGVYHLRFLVRCKGDDPIPRIKIVAVVTIVLILCVLIARPPQANARFVLIDPNKAFSPSAVTYTNKTMHFQVGDPYEGYSYWTYEVVGDVNAPSDNEYYQGTDTNGDAEYFGFDEFTDHSVVSAQVNFRTSAITGTYHFQPLGYFYQKTNLESNTRWALALDWDSSGVDLYYNTGNGDTPTSVNLVGTAPTIGVNYNITLSNLGDQTFVDIRLRDSPYTIIYSGYTTTESYDATSLYAGFGQYCSGAGSINGIHDDFAIFDSSFTYSEGGTGFSRVDAYVDEVFTQTLYDWEEETDPVLDIDETVTNITLLIDCWLNSTTYWVSTLAEGKNIIRLNITVTATNGTLVFSQANLTYISGTDYGDNVFLYQYSVQLDFTPIYGNIYTAVITLEVDEFQTIIETADYGELSDESYSADYVKTQALDGDPFSETGATDIEIWFEINTTDGFTGFSYAMYLYANSQTDCDLTFFNFDSGFFVKVDEPLPSSYDWMNGTINDPDYWNTTHVAIQLAELSGIAHFYWDYAEVAHLVDVQQWEDVGEATFNFLVGWNPTFQFGYDAIFIFAGLIMIPLSTMYLVRGGRKDLSMDKTFYFLILFIVGFALFIGGIMP